MIRDPASQNPGPSVEWRISQNPVGYDDAVAFMEQRVAAIAAGEAGECVWLLEHPALYTAGTSAQAGDLLAPSRFPVHTTGRGGQYTYHGPGQRVAYVMLDLKRRGGDVRKYVHDLENWIVATLAALGVHGRTIPGRVGVWVQSPAIPGSGNAKIAAIGVRVRRWVSYHGISLNVAPDLEHFSGIVPCGIADDGVTSLEALGLKATTDSVDQILQENFEAVFGAPLGAVNNLTAAQ